MRNSFRIKSFLRNIALSIIVLICINCFMEITICKHIKLLCYAKNKILIKDSSFNKSDGSSQGNVLNNGFVTKCGNWIYGTINGYGLSKLNLNNLKTQKIYDGIILNVYVIGKNIYFLNYIQDKKNNNYSYISRINEGSKHITRLINTPVESYYIYKSSIYYYLIKDQGKGGDYSIVKTDLDGKNKKVLYKQYVKDYKYPYITSFFINGKYLYFLKDGKSQLVKYDIQNKKIINISKLLHKSGIKQIDKFIVDGKEVFLKVLGKPLLYSMCIDGKQLKLISSNTDIDYFNTDDKWIYFSLLKPNGIKSGIYKVKKDGSSKIKISNIDGRKLNVIGKWIFCNGGNSETNLYMISTDGSGSYIKIR